MMQVESILSQHPGVTGTVIVGIPDARLAEMVVACIQLRKDWQWSHRSSLTRSISEEKLHLSSEILRQYCKEKNLPGYPSQNSYSMSKNAFLATRILQIFSTFSHVETCVYIYLAYLFYY